MDKEVFEMIYNLQKENIELKQAFVELNVLLGYNSNKKELIVLKHSDPVVSSVFKGVLNLIGKGNE